MSDTAAQPRSDGDESDDSSAATDEPTDPDEGQTAGAVSTGAESVVAALEAAGAKTAFGVQGGAIMPVYDALYDSSIRHVTMAHEQGAAHAADAYGVVAGEPGLCMATSG
ncbi:acetolactate synthase catalytic subunit, partial [Halorubrum ezzemoulense]